MKYFISSKQLVRVANGSVLVSFMLLGAAAIRLLMPANSTNAITADTFDIAASRRLKVNPTRAARRSTPAYDLRNPFVRAQDSVPTPPPQPAAPRPPLQPILLAGTVRFADGRYAAIIQFQGESRMLKKGQTIGDFGVRSIRKGEVKLSTRDTVITLKMVGP